MMNRAALLMILSTTAFVCCGCQCYRTTGWYSAGIDQVSDFKLRLDPLYVPGLDISRTGMSDWNRFGVNRWLCPCRGGSCPRCQPPIYYPAEYRLKYAAMQSETRQQNLPVEVNPDLEMAPLPLPAPKNP